MAHRLCSRCGTAGKPADREAGGRISSKRFGSDSVCEIGTLVTELCVELQVFAGEVASSPTGFSFERRIQIERCLFLIAKIISKRLLGYELHGFAPVYLEHLRALESHEPRSHDAILLVRRAFELRTALAALAVGEPYRTWEMAGPGSGGRRQVCVVFASQLRKYALHVAELGIMAGES